MTRGFRELRYVRRKVTDLDTSCRFASEVFGMTCEEKTDTQAMLRCDTRYYSLCLTTDLPDAIGLTVDNEADLEGYSGIFASAGHAVTPIRGDDAKRRIIKNGIAIQAPNAVHLEIVWRHMESGQPFHGSRHTGLNGFSAVQLASADIAADAAFWNAIPGLSISDYSGDAQFLSLGGAHHQIALYPSAQNGIIGAIWQVGTLDDVMRNWHVMRNRQVSIAHGPGRQPTSNAVFVTARAPEGFLMSYATAMDGPPALGPRQFRDTAKSHCAWGSPTDMDEFKGGDAE